MLLIELVFCTRRLSRRFLLRFDCNCNWLCAQVNIISGPASIFFYLKEPAGSITQLAPWLFYKDKSPLAACFGFDLRQKKKEIFK